MVFRLKRERAYDINPGMIEDSSWQISINLLVKDSLVNAFLAFVRRDECLFHFHHCSRLLVKETSLPWATVLYRVYDNYEMYLICTLYLKLIIIINNIWRGKPCLSLEWKWEKNLILLIADIFYSIRTWFNYTTIRWWPSFTPAYNQANYWWNHCSITHRAEQESTIVQVMYRS